MIKNLHSSHIGRRAGTARRANDIRVNAVSEGSEDMGQVYRESGLCRRLRGIAEVLNSQLLELDECGSSLAGAHVAQALEAIQEDLEARCGRFPATRGTDHDDSGINIYKLG